jgi:iron(III) transport system permease protein
MTMALHYLRSRIGGGLVLVILGTLFVYPMLRFLLIPWLPALGPATGPFGGQAGTDALSTLSLAAVGNSVQLGCAAGFLAIPAGLCLGFFLERRRWGGNSLLHAALFSRYGIIALLLMKGLPFACFTSRAGWSAIGGEIGDAVAIHVGSPWRRAYILVGLMLPAAGSIFAVVFVESIQDFGIAATLGSQIHLPLIAFGIYTMLATTPVDFAGASLLSCVLLALAVVAVGTHVYLGSRFMGALLHGRRREAPKPDCTKIENGFASCMLVLLAGVGIAIPSIALVGALFAPSDPVSNGNDDWNSLIYSAAFAGIAALFALLLATLFVTRQVHGRGWVARAVDLLTLGNMAIPGIVLGAAYVIAFNDGWLQLYGTPLLLVVAYVASHAPMLSRFLQPPISQVHRGISDAARMCGLPWLRRMTEIHGPLLMRPLVWGWSMAFGQIFFELPISELLYPAGQKPLAVQLVALDEGLHYAAEARHALAGVAVCLAVVGAIGMLLRNISSSGHSQHLLGMSAAEEPA